MEVLRLQSEFELQLKHSVNDSYTLIDPSPKARCKRLTLGTKKTHGRVHNAVFQPALYCFSPSLITASLTTSIAAFKVKGHCMIIATEVFVSLMNLPQLK